MMISKQKIDYSKRSNFEISMRVIERNSCQHKAELIDEFLNKIGEAKGYSKAGKTKSQTKTETLTEMTITSIEDLPWLMEVH